MKYSEKKWLSLDILSTHLSITCLEYGMTIPIGSSFGGSGLRCRPTSFGFLSFVAGSLVRYHHWRERGRDIRLGAFTSHCCTCNSKHHNVIRNYSRHSINHYT